MDHSNHMHHHHHMMDHNDTTTLPTTTAATLLQAVMTTVMAHGGHDQHIHHRHQASLESAHAGHSMDIESIPGDTSHHGVHASNGDHMLMVFHFGVNTVILFKEWCTSTPEGLIGSVIGIFILAMLYEGIKFFREYLFKKYFTSLEYSSVSVLGDDGKPVTEVHKVARNRMFSWPHILQTLLHIVQMVLSYFLMLIFMTYNVWLCMGVVGGAGMGYFLFGWRKATVVDITEHCH